MSTTLGCCPIRFFEPTSAFDEWLLRDIPKDTPIIDCGCGQGHVTKHLNNLGYSKAFGIDIKVSGDNEFCYYSDAMTFPFAEDWVPILCRPCHGIFVVDTVLNALERCGQIYYIGLERNYVQDLGWLAVPPIRVYNSVGSDGEHVWRITNELPFSED